MVSSIFYTYQRVTTMKPLKFSKSKITLFYIENKTIIPGINPKMKGDPSGLIGDCSGLIGDCTGLIGPCSGIEGDLDKNTQPMKDSNNKLSFYVEDF